MCNVIANTRQSKVPTGHQDYFLNKRGTSVGDPEPHLSATKQVSGEAIYTDDIPRRPNEVYGSFVTATRYAHDTHCNVTF